MERRFVSELLIQDEYRNDTVNYETSFLIPVATDYNDYRLVFTGLASTLTRC